eukprot:6192103-Pleurochrysis_carterae.AAC.5
METIFLDLDLQPWAACVTASTPLLRGAFASAPAFFVVDIRRSADERRMRGAMALLTRRAAKYGHILLHIRERASVHAGGESVHLRQEAHC